MIEELRRVNTELDSNPTNLDLIERYIVLSQRMGRDFQKDWFPVGFDDIKYFFNNNKNLMETYIEIQNHYSFGYPACAAFYMVEFSESDKKWAENVIENATVGDPSWAAYEMVKCCESNRVWAEDLVENTRIGDPSYSAYCMVKDCGSSKSWGEKVIEDDKVGFCALSAYLMTLYCESDRSWAEKVIEKSSENIFHLSELMVLRCGSSRDWADKLVASRRTMNG